MLTNSDDSDNIFKALQAGAVGYISKKRMNPSIIQDAVYTVHRGGSYMSPRIARQVVAFHGQQRKASVSIDPADRLTPRQLDIVQGLVDNLSYRRSGSDWRSVSKPSVTTSKIFTANSGSIPKWKSYTKS